MSIDPNRTLLDIAETWPETVPVFVAEGFPQMEDPTKRRMLGAAVTLRQALDLRGLDVETFVARLQRTVDENRTAAPVDVVAPVRVAGLLPCPVRIPIEEAFDAFADGYRSLSGRRIERELQAASVGAGWIAEQLAGVTDASGLPDLFLSAGFETFFDDKGIGRFRKDFYDGLPFDGCNETFDGVGLRDPQGHYGVISAVPAVFLVNTEELGDLPAPRSWEDLLHPRFEQRVSLPVGDFDLFSAILLDIEQRYGADGVRALGRSLLSSMHPAQMVKLNKKSATPIVTIMPYFFTKMARPGTPLQAVWPEDGAIVSPIFLLAKRESRDFVQPIVDFFASKEVGELLATKGLFPSLHPAVDNGLEPGAPFSWLGWDTIGSLDIPTKIAECQRIFEEESAQR